MKLKLVRSYRLGAPGFLTSKELRNAGYKPNNGLVDQRNALKWIKKHIGGFHGDAQNVTLVGQSAGGGNHITSTLICQTFLAPDL